MKFDIVQNDPLQILSSTKSVIKNLTHVKLHEDKLTEIAKIVAKKLRHGLHEVATSFGDAGNMEDTVQLVFLEDVVNYCYWAEKGKTKWEVEWPVGKIQKGGWYGLTKCFQRALSENVPILNADYLAGMTVKQAQSFFRGRGTTKIPLFKERLEGLQQAGNMLKKKYKGKFINALEQADFDTVNIVKMLGRDFPSFDDHAIFKGKKVYFYKRAQICAQDCSIVMKKYHKKIKNLEVLAAFADYKVPQMLRKYGVTSYDKKLSKKVDNYVLIPQGSLEEIEIRAATIWCVELIRQKLKKFSAPDIDNALWLISQDQSDTQPYHRTYTIFY